MAWAIEVIAPVRQTVGLVNAPFVGLKQHSSESCFRVWDFAIKMVGGARNLICTNSNCGSETRLARQPNSRKQEIHSRRRNKRAVEKCSKTVGRRKELKLHQSRVRDDFIWVRKELRVSKPHNWPQPTF